MIINLLNDQAMKNLNLLQKWYVIDSQSAKEKCNQNNSIKFEAERVKSSLCDYSHAFILVTGDIIVNANHDTHDEFKNCEPFSTCKTEINMFLFMKQIIITLQCLCAV